MKKQILKRLRNIEGFMFDMDGTLVLGDRANHEFRPLPGAVEFLTHLTQINIPFVVLTNGTVRTARDYAPVLSKAGLPLKEHNMMTPSSVAADYFTRRRYRRIMVLGCEGVWRPLADAGLEVVLSTAADPGPVDAVYLGWYREFTMRDLESACHAVWDGATPYSASNAPVFATAQGPGIGTSGVLSAMLKSVTGRSARVLGKPSLEALRSSARRLGVRPENMAVVGDDPNLEVPMAHKGRAMSIYVHTGTGGGRAFKDVPRHRHPHVSVPDVRELLRLYTG
jgi:HAD superfamily hydrolase (TIGR01450 family)